MDNFSPDNSTLDPARIKSPGLQNDHVAMSTSQPRVSLSASQSMPRSAALVRRAFRAEDRYLLVSSSSDPDRLVLPAGKTSPHETAVATATRECREEAGALIRPVRYLGVYVHHKTSGAVLPTDVYLARWEGWTVPAESRRIEWVTEHELLHGSHG